MAIINLYRLFAIQDLGGFKQIAIYVCEGESPDPEILGDSQAIAKEETSINEISFLKPWVYNNRINNIWTDQTLKNRQQLIYYLKLLKRSRKLIDGKKNSDKALFVNSTNKKDWHGEKILYQNEFFDEFKTDYPTFSGCKPLKTIKI